MVGILFPLDYTIVVPKNIHVKGVNVQLGLKTGEEMLATVSEKHNHKYAPANRIPSRSSNFNGSNCEHSPNGSVYKMFRFICNSRSCISF